MLRRCTSAVDPSRPVRLPFQWPAVRESGRKLLTSCPLQEVWLLPLAMILEHELTHSGSGKYPHFVRPCKAGGFKCDFDCVNFKKRLEYAPTQ